MGRITPPFMYKGSVTILYGTGTESGEQEFRV